MSFLSFINDITRKVFKTLSWEDHVNSETGYVTVLLFIAQYMQCMHTVKTKETNPEKKRENIVQVTYFLGEDGCSGKFSIGFYTKVTRKLIYIKTWLGWVRILWM